MKIFALLVSKKWNQTSSMNRISISTLQKMTFLTLLTVISTGLVSTGVLQANDRVYHPLDQYAPTGRAAHWAAATGQPRPRYVQPVRVHLPSTGEVTFYGQQEQTVPSPSMAGLTVSEVFRLKLANMPEYPSVELYPTIEMLDHLHPPKNENIKQYPIEIEITEKELDLVVDGGLISKVIYLEEAKFATPKLQTSPSPTLEVSKKHNLIQEADRIGRPMLIFRLGGRQPSTHNPDNSFFTPHSTVVGYTQNQQQEMTAQRAGVAHAVSTEIEQLGKHSRIYQTSASSRMRLGKTQKGVTERLRHYEMYPDEYIVDGGDRGLPIHYQEEALAGLESEDTVAEYSTHLGKREVMKSNRVVIYSPRFRALSVHQQPFSRTSLAKLGGIHDQIKGVGMNQSLSLDKKIQKTQLDGIRTRSRGSELEQDQGFSGLDQHTYVTGHTKLINVYQDLQYVKAGRFERMSSAEIKSGLLGAFAWSKSSFPIVAASTSAGMELQARFKPAEIVGVDTKKGAPGKLRIVKLADRVEAKSGDLITFTIRYDNMGGHAVQGVKITDHLTPRLEFVEGSFKTDRKGAMRLLDQDIEKSIFRFELEGKLKPKEGGVLSFQCRVR